MFCAFCVNILILSTGFVDIDECAESNPCAQICNNTNGSYQCSCNNGFLLDGDGHSCNGKRTSRS